MKRRQSKKEVRRKSKELIYRKCRNGNFSREKVTEGQKKRQRRRWGKEGLTAEQRKMKSKWVILLSVASAHVNRGQCDENKLHNAAWKQPPCLFWWIFKQHSGLAGLASWTASHEINMKPPILKDAGLFLVRCFASVLVIKTTLQSRFKVVFLVFRPISLSVAFQSLEERSQLLPGLKVWCIASRQGSFIIPTFTESRTMWNSGVFVGQIYRFWILKIPHATARELKNRSITLMGREGK